MTEIIPAILAHTETELRAKLAVLPHGATSVHVDFVKMCFASGLRLCFFEAHLMFPHPAEYVVVLVKAGFSRIVIQVESVSHETFAELIHEWKHAVEIAPSLEIETPLEVIDSYAHELASVQLMGIAEIGAQGMVFDERVIPRVAALHAKYPHLTIAVDGGVNKENAERLVEAGARRFVVGSAIGEFFKTEKTTPPFPSP